MEVLRHLPIGVVVAGAPRGELLFASAEALRIWGEAMPAPGEVVVGRWRGFHPDGREYQEEEWPLARALARGEAVEEEEIEIQRGDGRRTVIQAGAYAVRDGAGQVEAGVLTFREAREAGGGEGTRRLLAEASRVLGSSLDYATTLRDVARLLVPALADWCGVDVVHRDGRIERLVVEHADPRKQARAADLARRYPPNPEAPAGVARVLRTGRPELLSEIDDRLLREVAQDDEHLRALREMGFSSAMILPLTARGKTIGALRIIAAESRRRYTPEDLALAEELAARAALAIDNARLHRELQAANRTKTDFLSLISHELRTPLTTIIGYAELLELGIPEPVMDSQREHVERIHASALELLQMIEQILSVASLEAGESRIQPQRVGLREILQRAEEVFGPVAAARGVSLNIPDAEPRTLLTDRDKLLQVLFCVLSNALKFTDRGEVRVAARAEEDWLAITVRDTGMGMNPGEMALAFEPFWQAERPSTRRIGGTGLGLTIARRLLRMLGGEIQLRSAPGAGTTVQLRLPLHHRAEEGA